MRYVKFKSEAQKEAVSFLNRIAGYIASNNEGKAIALVKENMLNIRNHSSKNDEWWRSVSGYVTGDRNGDKTPCMRQAYCLINRLVIGPDDED